MQYRHKQKRYLITLSVSQMVFKPPLKKKESLLLIFSLHIYYLLTSYL